MLLLVAPATGCKNTAKHDNPVMHAPPRRLAAATNETSDTMVAEDEGDSDVELTSATAGADGEDDSIFGAQVVCRVDGTPIFASEVLERYGPFLREVREQDPSKLGQLRDQIIERDLMSHIEKKLLVNAMKTQLKPDQLKAMDGYLDKVFEKEIERLKAEMKVNTRTELELELEKIGTSLDEVRTSFGNQRIAMEYLGTKAEKPKAVTRKRMLDFYYENEAQFTTPARVRWQEIRVSFHDDREAAARKLRDAQNSLKAGRPWAEVARKYSDSANASEGGEHDWMKRDSLADEKLEELIFSAPVRTAVKLHQGQQAYHLVQILEREDEAVQPFEEVQDAIRVKLEVTRDDFVQGVMDDLFDDAVIEPLPRFARAATRQAAAQ